MLPHTVLLCVLLPLQYIQKQVSRRRAQENLTSPSVHIPQGAILRWSMQHSVPRQTLRASLYQSNQRDHRPFTQKKTSTKLGRISVRREFGGSALGSRICNGSQLFAARWLENSAEAEVPVPLDKAWRLWEDRESIPKFMPWIKSVTVQPEDPKLSRWLLSTNQFGRDWDFSWLAQNLTPIKNQKIHWRSVQGSSTMGSALDIANRGQIRFYRKSATTCAVKLTISYELPDALAPFGSGLTPLVESILKRDMERFVVYAQQQS